METTNSKKKEKQMQENIINWLWAGFVLALIWLGWLLLWAVGGRG